MASFGADLLRKAPAYMATIRANGVPRVHPVSLTIGDGQSFVFVEPTSPNGADLRRGVGTRCTSACSTPSAPGASSVSGQAVLVDGPVLPAVAAKAAGYNPPDRFVLFELGVAEARVQRLCRRLTSRTETLDRP